MADPQQDDVTAMSFEMALAELEQIVAKLESGQAPLAESIAIYERGEALKAHCEAEGCPYNVRLVAACIAIGPPWCPVHGAMTVDAQAGAAGDEACSTPPAATAPPSSTAPARRPPANAAAALPATSSAPSSAAPGEVR